MHFTRPECDPRCLFAVMRKLQANKVINLEQCVKYLWDLYASSLKIKRGSNLSKWDELLIAKRLKR